MIIDYYSRHQPKLSLSDLFPQLDKKCACGCGNELTGRKTRWFSNNCRDKSYTQLSIIKGDNFTIRNEVLKRDNAICKKCGCKDNIWFADHIIPVHLGGGACGIENFQTLCKKCHDEKTKAEMINFKK